VTRANVLTRRQVLRLFSLLLGGKALAGEPLKPAGDNGIGGTGLKPGDNGIGGTGFLGTIRRFGSIYVNGERIAYPPDVLIRLDDVVADSSALRIGQVARLIADRRNETWRTDRIVIESEVVGAIQKIEQRRLTVLGQRIDLPGAGLSRTFKVGDRVAVSGLRRPDQTIVASLLQKRSNGPDQIAGVLLQEDDGVFQIGGQPISGVGTAIVGERLITRGVLQNGVFVAREVKVDTGAGLGQTRNVSIETWLSRRDGVLETADGLQVEDQSGGLRPGSYVAVINGEIQPGGVLIARQIEFPNGRGGFNSPGGPRGRGPDGAPGGGMNGPGHPRGPGGGPGGGPGAPSGPSGPSGPAGDTTNRPDGGGAGPGGFGPGGFGPGGGPGGPGGFIGGGPSGFGGRGPSR